MLITKDFQKRITPNLVESMLLLRMRLHTELHSFTTKHNHDKLFKQLRDYTNHIKDVSIKMNESIILLLKTYTTNNKLQSLAVFLNVLYFNIFNILICDMGRGIQRRSVAISLFSCITMLFQWIFGMCLPVIFVFLTTNWLIFPNQKRFVDGWLSWISSFVYGKKPYSSGTNYYHQLLLYFIILQIGLLVQSSFWMVVMCVHSVK